MATAVKKVVLAYSGGLDTSIILKWLQETYGCEVVTFTADLGQGEELEPARKKAEMLGIKENIFIEDLREEFVRDFVFPMFRANALYEGVYLLGTSIARPLIAKQQIEIAAQTGADAVCARRHRQGQRPGALRAHLLRARTPTSRSSRPGASGTSRAASDLIDVRREAPDPGRQGQARRGAVLGRRQPAALLLRRQGAGGPGASSRRPTSISAPSRPRRRPTRRRSSRSASRRAMPVSHRRQDAVARRRCSRALNELGRDNGIGRLDLVENRFVGMKSRGVYETPGGTILLAAHRAIESHHARPRRRRTSRTS